MESVRISDPESAGSVSFATLLRRYRLAAGLTQEELAERARLSARAISDLERGTRRIPRRDTIELLTEALELSPHDFATLEASVPRRRGPPAESETDDMLSVLPAWISPLVGREHHEAEAVHLLMQDGTRLLTLTGPGGVGKTQLAIQVATSLQHDAVETAVFVPLATVGDPDLVLPAIATALGGRESPGQPLLESVIARLRGRRALLLLDNFEHLLNAASVVGDLLGACPDLKILATSRAPLHLRWEQELAVPPLALPDPEDTSFESLARSPAIVLFLQCARAVRPDFDLTPDTASAVADLCRRVDGLPLAIELAAARVKVLPPRALLGLFHDRLRILSGGPRDLVAGMPNTSSPWRRRHGMSSRDQISRSG
jgi:transcriptional regulator with XRE-family HTH domain